MGVFYVFKIVQMVANRAKSFRRKYTVKQFFLMFGSCFYCQSMILQSSLIVITSETTGYISMAF